RPSTSHPDLEGQLASLHQDPTCGFPAYGSDLELLDTPSDLKRLLRPERSRSREVSAPAWVVRPAVSPGPVCAPGLRLAAAEWPRACAEFPARPLATWRYRPPSAAERPRVGL